MNDLVIAIGRQDNKVDEAAVVCLAGIELFPNSTVLRQRIAEYYVLKGDKAAAALAYQKALVADPYNQVAAVALKKL